MDTDVIVSTDPNDILFMQMAITEASQSQPRESSYCVGTCIVKNGKVLSKGFSRELEGNTHAEECALAKLPSLDDARGATIYTTMEPCSIRLSGNRSCTSRLIEAQVRRVVVGVLEPPTLVQCNGIQLLREAGIIVQTVDKVPCPEPNTNPFVGITIV